MVARPESSSDSLDRAVPLFVCRQCADKIRLVSASGRLERLDGGLLELGDRREVVFVNRSQRCGWDQSEKTDPRRLALRYCIVRSVLWVRTGSIVILAEDSIKAYYERGSLDVLRDGESRPAIAVR